MVLCFFLSLSLSVGHFLFFFEGGVSGRCILIYCSYSLEYSIGAFPSPYQPRLRREAGLRTEKRERERERTTKYIYIYIFLRVEKKFQFSIYPSAASLWRFTRVPPSIYLTTYIYCKTEIPIPVSVFFCLVFICLCKFRRCSSKTRRCIALCKKRGGGQPLLVLSIDPIL